MIVKQSIKCQKCGAIVIKDAKSLEMYVMTAPIKCPKCGVVVIDLPTMVTY